MNLALGGILDRRRHAKHPSLATAIRARPVLVLPKKNEIVKVKANLATIDIKLSLSA